MWFNIANHPISNPLLDSKLPEDEGWIVYLDSYTLYSLQLTAQVLATWKVLNKYWIIEEELDKQRLLNWLAPPINLALNRSRATEDTQKAAWVIVTLKSENLQES